MNRAPLYRNIRSRTSLEIFLLSAVSSLLAVRFYLHVTGYPQVGGDTLHIAHMLWGGLLMLAALTIVLTYLGAWSQRLAALVGGAGFGVFIDEIGKFITHDNDYFFRPAVGIIYLIFAGLYLLFCYLTREHKLTSREYQLNALAQLEEAVAADMDPSEKARVMELLDKADGRSALTRQLKQLVGSLDVAPPPRPGWLERLSLFLDDRYRRFWLRRESRQVVRLVFGLQAALLTVGVLSLAYANVDDVLAALAGDAGYQRQLLIGQMLAGSVALALVCRALWLLGRSRLLAFQALRMATLINLLLTQVFIFFREQFAALPGFGFNLLLLLIISYALYQERRLRDLS